MVRVNKLTISLVLCCALWVASGEVMAENPCSTRDSLVALAVPLKFGDLKKLCGDIFLQGHGLYYWTQADDVSDKDYQFLFKLPEWMRNKEDPRWKKNFVEEELEIGAIMLVDRNDSNDVTIIWPKQYLEITPKEVIIQLWGSLVSEEAKTQ